MSKKISPSTRRLQSQIDDLRSQLAAIDLVCPGSLLKRTKVCGKPNCRCAKDPKHRHGPYYEWSRWENGRLVHSVLPPHQAKLIASAIKNHRKAQRLLASWSQKSLKLIRSLPVPSPDNNPS
jgi:hypothetical protein